MHLAKKKKKSIKCAYNSNTQDSAFYNVRFCNFFLPKRLTLEVVDLLVFLFCFISTKFLEGIMELLV